MPVNPNKVFGGEMSENIIASDKPPAHGLVILTHVIYALHAVTVLTGLLTPVLIVTAFLTGWPSLLGVILNYVKRKDTRGTYLESHFRWQISTFWFALMWVIVAGLLVFTLIGIPVAFGLAYIVGIWVLYRVARGWLRLNSQRAMP